MYIKINKIYYIMLYDGIRGNILPTVLQNVHVKRKEKTILKGLVFEVCVF